MYIIPIDYQYLRRPAAPEEKKHAQAAAAAAPEPELPRYKNFNLAELKEMQQFNDIWEEINAFLDMHKATFNEYPYKRCNVRFVADKTAEPLIRKLHEIQIPYLMGRDQIDVELFYYYIIGSGREFFDQVVVNPDHARHVWERKLFEPPQ